MTWSVDEKKIVFTNTTAKGIELWVLDLETALASRISAGPLNANLGRPYSLKKENHLRRSLRWFS